MTDLFVSSVSVKPAAPGTLYAGTEGAGVFKSTDGGASWSEFNTGLENRCVSVISVNPFSMNNLCAGTEGGGVNRYDYIEDQGGGCGIARSPRGAGTLSDGAGIPILLAPALVCLLMARRAPSRLP